MNNFSKVHDFLLHNQQLHARTAEFYRELSLDVTSERIKMLLNILVVHQTKLSTSLRDYIEKTPSKVLDTFFQFDREQSIEHLFTTEYLRNQISCDDVEIIANRFDQYFCELYEEMKAAVDFVTIQELFENLRFQMEQGKKRLSIDIISMEDI
jgi:hypothetical protein